VTHGKRVVALLQIQDLFEGMTYCDYGEAPFACKPHAEMFDKAMREAGVTDNKNCYFVGESSVLHTIGNAIWTLTSIRRFLHQR
jgi:pyrimidine and pyridine-specific 5'-nucleotidase